MDNTPAASFQRLCQIMLDGSSKDLTKKSLEDFRVILHMIMHECSKANIEAGKIWMFEHCHTAMHAHALFNYILSLTSSRQGQEERIHMIYLVNDILFHTARRQLTWMQDAMLPLLAPLLKLAYEIANSAEYEAKVIKVLSFWGDQNIFDPSVIHHMRQVVTGQLPMDSPYPPPPLIHQQQQHHLQHPHQQQFQQHQHQLQQQQHHQQQQQLQQHHHHQHQHQQQQQQQQKPRIPITPPQPPRNYYELPAGLMLLAQTHDYKPIDPTTLKFPFPRPVATPELMEAVDDYYKGLQDELILDEKSDMDAQGWEKGYLDSYFQSVLEKRSCRGRSTSRDDAYRQRHSSPIYYGRRRRYSSSRSYSSSPQRSPSPRRSSPLRRRSPTTSTNRPRSPYRRSSPDHIRGRSPPRAAANSIRRASPPPNNNNRRGSPTRRISPARRSSPRRSPSRDRYRRYSRSRSPPSASNYPPPSLSQTNYSNFRPQQQHQQQQSGFGKSTYSQHRGAPENRYLGLGNASDEFDSFRRNKSQAYK
ncbi:hypothetical protein INT47_009051 [Mucor saturninus]|uniref:CID domain-containing protein n=1 Tax=Mucor saturninus TaxID=64648 RepID=A0A8H7RMR1_9FUNG|nr:hypothetical protein INT47_009051 [Mucor saturninus]